MKKQKITKTFNLKELDVLTSDENSCIFLHKKEEHLALHPYHLSDLTNSVKEILNLRVGKFCVGLDGILCGYKNIKFLSKLGHISDDSCFIHVDIEAEFYIFKPTVERILEGTVHKKSTDHVGCLVHKVFNVSLPKPKHSEDWIGESLNINSKIQFEITYTNFDGKLPYIRGEIINVLDYSNDYNTSEDITQKSSKEKKAKKTLFADDDLAPQEDLDAVVETETSPTKKKKRKKEWDDSEEPVKKKKKKK